MSPTVVAGLVSTVVFAMSTLPMVARAWRTKDMASYSRGHLVMTNIGNAVHTLYVLSLPPGPVWVLHTFHVVVSAAMLFWHLRFAGAQQMHSEVPSRELPCG